jgi:hypothetical protein
MFVEEEPVPVRFQNPNLRIDASAEAMKQELSSRPCASRHTVESALDRSASAATSCEQMSVKLRVGTSSTLPRASKTRSNVSLCRAIRTATLHEARAGSVMPSRNTQDGKTGGVGT